MVAPALSVGTIDRDGAGAITDGLDTYTNSLALETEIPSGTPCSFIRVGRSLQPLGAAGFHVSVDPVSVS